MQTDSKKLDFQSKGMLTENMELTLQVFKIEFTIKCTDKNFCPLNIVI